MDTLFREWAQQVVFYFWFLGCGPLSEMSEYPLVPLRVQPWLRQLLNSHFQVNWGNNSINNNPRMHFSDNWILQSRWCLYVMIHLEQSMGLGYKCRKGLWKRYTCALALGEKQSQSWDQKQFKGQKSQLPLGKKDQVVWWQRFMVL